MFGHDIYTPKAASPHSLYSACIHFHYSKMYLLQQADAVMAQLDYREKGGYDTRTVQVVPRHGGAAINALVYIGTTDNPHYINAEPLEAAAAIIARSAGPSGPNHVYLFNLVEAMRHIAPEHADDHLTDLEAAVGQAMGEPAWLQAREAARVAVAEAASDAIHRAHLADAVGEAEAPSAQEVAEAAAADLAEAMVEEMSDQEETEQRSTETAPDHDEDS